MGLASSFGWLDMATRASNSSRRAMAQPLDELELLKLAAGRFVYRRCHICDWEGQLAQSPAVAQGASAGKPPSEHDCPICHAPTDLVAFLQPMSQTDALHKNPYAAALGRRGGQRGGPARAALLSPKRRREIARKAAQARWKKR